jgi:hypothetical protein
MPVRTFAGISGMVARMRLDLTMLKSMINAPMSIKLQFIIVVFICSSP